METYKYDCQKKTTKLSNSFMIGVYMSFKRTGEIAVITSKSNADLYIEILANSLIPSIENWFGDEVIVQDLDTACHRTIGIKGFLRKVI